MASTVSAPVKIAIYGSGKGTNAQAIIDHFRKQAEIEVALIVSNKPDAYILRRATQSGVDSVLLATPEERSGEKQLQLLKNRGIDLVVLAGYIRKLPDAVLEAYQGRVLNIHPSLLPRFGGKGMYGRKVHEAVLAANETESGITIHRPNTEYDSGEIIFQQPLQIQSEWTVEDLEFAVQQLEHLYYPKIIEAEARKLLGQPPNPDATQS